MATNGNGNESPQPPSSNIVSVNNHFELFQQTERGNMTTVPFIQSIFKKSPLLPKDEVLQMLQVQEAIWKLKFMEDYREIVEQKNDEILQERVKEMNLNRMFQLLQTTIESLELTAANLQETVDGYEEEGEGGGDVNGMDSDGDSDSVHSQVYEDEPIRDNNNDTGKCKVCRSRHASVVVMPCRHLCLCMECNEQVEQPATCNICHSARTGCLHVRLH